MDVPSWKGRGRLATAKECRRKTLDPISVGRERMAAFVAQSANHVSPIELHPLAYRTHVGGHCIQFSMQRRTEMHPSPPSHILNSD